MLSAFTNRSPVVYVLILIYTVLLHIPTFHSGYVATDEAIYLTIGKRIAEGYQLYAEAWDNKPPLIYWFYYFVYLLSGEYAIILLRVLSCINVFLAALIFSHILYTFRFSQEHSLFPIFVFITAVCCPWYALELNAEHLMLLPTLIAVFLFCTFFIDEKRSRYALFYIGSYCGLCLGLKYQGGLHLMVILIAYLLIARTKISEIITLIGAFLLTIFIIFFILYFQGILPDFIDLGFIYNFDYIIAGRNPGETPTFQNALEYLKVWGSYIILAVLGFFTFKIKYYTTGIRQRRVEIVFSIWLFFAIVSILLGGKRLYLHYFIYAIPPILFYSFYYYSKIKQRLIKSFISVLFFIFPIFTFIVYFIVINSQVYLAVKPYTKSQGWLDSLYLSIHGSPDFHALKTYLEKYSPEQSIWVAGFEPELYVKLNRSCAMKYVNYSMVHYKLDWLNHNFKNLALVSKAEDRAKVYRVFSTAPPYIIIDSTGIFEEILSKIPLLLQRYKPTKVGKYTVYEFN